MSRKSQLRNAKKVLVSKGVFRKELASIGLAYEKYLKTDWWLNLREKYLLGASCSGCGHPASELHHVNYANLGHETELDVIPLCRLCHAEVHRRLDDSKKSIEWTAWALRKMFEWTRKETNQRFNLSYVPGKKMSVMAGKI